MPGLGLFVRSADGGQQAVELNPDATVGDLRQALRDAGRADLAEACLTFAGAALATDGALFSDLGVGQEAVVDAAGAAERSMTWERVGDDWDTDGVSCTSARKNQSKAALASTVMESGRHVWAWRMRIPSRGGSNFSVGITHPESPLDKEIYLMDIQCVLLEHADAYHDRKGKEPRRGFFPDDILLFDLDLDQGTFNIWREEDGKVTRSHNVAQDAQLEQTDLLQQLVSFTNVQGPKVPCVGTLNSGDYGAEIVRVPVADWTAAALRGGGVFTRYAPVSCGAQQ
eukprot:TRINITY_DN15305_c0_g1_i1.p1 TRINITY_DN15305_c0_g1~~TRINITY_DN15305_c0_g1_i1.p1  ORF type:complete len:310 (+),score=98.38 TRINITY_DN15305_c0_g1_i1:79-930(+)